MTLVKCVLIIFVIYLCVYALVSRACKCIERCAMARAYSNFRENDIPLKDWMRLQQELHSKRRKEEGWKICGKEN